jgi:hypothetical protein
MERSAVDGERALGALHSSAEGSYNITALREPEAHKKRHTVR